MITIFEVLKAGKSLKNPETWKNVGMTSQATALVFSFIIHCLPLFGVHLPFDQDITDQVIQPISDGISGGLFLLSFYLIPATSKKVGLQSNIGTGD